MTFFQKNNIYKAAAIILYTTLIWNLAILLHNGKPGFNSFGNLVAANAKIVPCTVEQRLSEANEIWLRGLENRKQLEATRPLDPSNPFHSGVMFWEFFYPTFDCPYLVERIGNSGDGGKWICGLSKLNEKIEPCIVYSYGISTQYTFEENILQRSKCSVFMFDHTIDVTQVNLISKYPGRVFIEKVGLAIQDGGDLRTLTTLMKKYNHNFVDILKMDVKGAEFDVMDSFKNQYSSGLPFGQLAVEIHLPTTPDPDFYNKHRRWMTNLEDMGLRAFRNEWNWRGTRSNPPDLSEYSYLNIKTDHWLLH